MQSQASSEALQHSPAGASLHADPLLCTGHPSSPALVYDEDERGHHRWRYLMPEGGPPDSSWLGAGEGTYQPLEQPQRMVALVGSAHVRGMLREWELPQDNGRMQAVLDGSGSCAV